MVADDSSGLFRRLMSPRDAGFCALVIVVSLVLRWPAMTTSLWVDELHSSWVVADGWSEVVTRAQQGNQSPVYFLLLRAWVEIAGTSEITLRFPSLVAGVMLAVGVGTLVRHTTREPWLGLLAGLLIASDSRFIFYATEARPYALLQCLALVHIVTACRRWEAPRRWWRVAFLVSGAGLFHLHYTGALLWGASAAISLVSSRSADATNLVGDSPPALRRRVADVLLDFVGILLLCSPALPHLLSVLQRRQAWNSFVPADPPLHSILTSLHALHFVTIPLLGFLIHAAVRYGLAAWYGLPGLSRNQPAGHLGHDNDRPENAWFLSQCWAMACWWLIPVMVAWLATRADVARLFFPRYLIGSAAGAVALGASCLSPLSPLSFRFTVAAVTLVAALVVDGYALRVFSDNSRPLRHENWRGLVSVLAALPTGDQRLLLVRSGLIEADGLLDEKLPALEREQLEEYSRYMFAGIYALPGEQWTVESVANTSPFGIAPSIQRKAREQREVWLAIRGARSRTPQLATQILEQLADDQMTWKVEGRWRLGNVALFVARLSPTESYFR